MQEERNNTNDWQTVKLGDLGRFNKGKGISKNQLVAEGVPCVRYGELYTQHHYQIRKIQSYITKETANECYKLSTGDILFAGSGETREEIGKCATFLGEQETYAGGDIIVFSPCESDPTFLGYLLNSENVRRQKAQMGQGDAVVHIYANSLKELDLKIPKRIGEQTAIATALSDADALITALEKLIEKKRMIKQGAMQELLRPKKGWKTKRLGEIGESLIGLTYSPQNVSSTGTLVLRSSNIQNGRLTFDDNVYVNMQIPEKIKLKSNDILICVRNGSRDLIGKCVLIPETLKGETFGAFMAVYRSSYYYYVYQVFQSEIIKRQIDQHLGATINQITNKSLNSFEIPFPPQNEQIRIADSLSAMEHEIDVLESKLRKYKLIKEGMMQELLTGRTRLI